MPRKGLPRCECGARKYWLVKDGFPRYKIECRTCGKQRYSRAKFRRLALELKPGEKKT